MCRTLSDPALYRQRDAFTLICMYTAYLITVHDDGARDAFVLLAGAEKMHLNAAQKGYKMKHGNVHNFRQYGAANSSRSSGRYSDNDGGDSYGGYGGEEDFEVGDYDTASGGGHSGGSSSGNKALFSQRHNHTAYSGSNERFNRGGDRGGAGANNKYRTNNNGNTASSRGGSSGRYSNSEYEDTDRFAKHSHGNKHSNNKYKY